MGEEMIIESCQEKLLGILIDTKLPFEDHVNNLWKAGKKNSMP